MINYNTMNILKKIPLLMLFGTFLVGCGDKSARHPVMKKTSTFLKESAKKNKALLKTEEALIDSIIKRDTVHTFVDSQNGFKFYYTEQKPEASYTAQFGDLVTYDYSLSDLRGKEIYQEKPDGEYTYKVDQQELFQGLNSALKLLKEGESGVFYFPSSMAYGYRGDKDKIGTNQPVIARIQVFKIEKNKEKIAPRPE